MRASPIRDRFRVVAFPKPSADDLDALLPAVIADLARERGLDESWVTPLDGIERAAAAQHWSGGSVAVCAASSRPSCASAIFARSGTNQAYQPSRPPYLD